MSPSKEWMDELIKVHQDAYGDRLQPAELPATELHLISHLYPGEK